MASRLTPDTINTLLFHHHRLTLSTLPPGLAERAALLARAVLLLLAHHQVQPGAQQVHRQASLTSLFQVQDTPLPPPVRSALRDYLTALPGVCLSSAALTTCDSPCSITAALPGAACPRWPGWFRTLTTCCHHPPFRYDKNDKTYLPHHHPGLPPGGTQGRRKAARW